VSSRAVGRTLLFTILVPGSVTLLIPGLLLGRNAPRPAAWVNCVGMVPCVLGALTYLACAWWFATVGEGTPAPIEPTKTLVVSGLYRFVRNPMYVGVEAVLLGEALLFGSARLLVYATLVGVGFELFVRFYEEPALTRRFGASYREYCRAVPRWIPRLSPWPRPRSGEG